jgi:phage tail-like protein
MSFSNLEYLYEHLPARIRIADQEQNLLLKRLLSVHGERLDEWDQVLDTFYQKIDPATASEEFVFYWLWALFGWSWYPSWYTLVRKRKLFADFAVLLARRGTRIGIQDWLREFSIFARVWNKPQYCDEAYLGEEGWFIDQPRGLVVQVSHLADEVNGELFAAWQR